MTAAKTIDLPDEDATLALGRALAAAISPGVSIHLSGDLGAGKTTLSRGILRGLGYDGRVKSPTYTLVEVYVFSKLDLYHFDFYRFNDPEEWTEAGFRDHFNDHNACLVEWPERAGSLLPPPDLAIHLVPWGEGRRATVTASTARGASLLESLSP